MNPKMKKVLLGFAALLVAVALIAIAPVSRIVYAIYDTNRTNTILKQLEEAEKDSGEAAVNDFHKQAFLFTSEEADGGKTIEKMDLLVLTSDSVCELSYYERVVEGSASYTSRYFHMTCGYTREGNVLTVEPGIGVLAVSPNGNSYTYYNAQFLTAEEAGGDKTRDEIYSMQYDSREIALMSDGSFAVGGKSDSKDELGAPAGRNVYTDAVLQGRVTYKTLVTMDDGTYILYSQATNSNNAEQTTGSMFGYGSYVIKDSDKGITPDAALPEQTYDIVTGEPGLGFMYANNNGSHMHFDLQNQSGFLSWLATNFNAPRPTFYVSESGFTMKIGALKTVIGPWGLYIPAADAGQSGEEEPVAESFKLELETSVEGKPFVLELKADGTLVTGWTNYEQTMLEGTWKIADGTLVLEMDYTSTIVKNADGGLDITINYGQMGEKVYTMTAEQFAALSAGTKPAGQDVKLELETSVEGKPFVLELKADGTLVTGWTNYEQTMMEGTWKIADGSLVLDVAYESTIVKNAAGGLDITVNYGQMGEKVYTMTAEQFAALKGEEAATELVKVELETSAEGKPFILQFNSDGTLVTGWTNYEQTLQTGKWSVEGGTLALDCVYPATITKTADGLEIAVDYGQMGTKVYTLTAAQVAALMGEDAVAALITLEIETSAEGKPFILQFNADGSLLTGWTNYEQTMMEGTWTVNGGNLVLDCAYPATVVVNDNGLEITVNYGQMGEKVYSMTIEQAMTLKGEEAVTELLKLEIETSVEGKPFILQFNSDGSLLTGWTNYEQTMMEGTWTVNGSTLVLDCAYPATITETADGLEITVNYGQMGEKVYSMTTAQAKAIFG